MENHISQYMRGFAYYLRSYCLIFLDVNNNFTTTPFNWRIIVGLSDEKIKTKVYLSNLKIVYKCNVRVL